MSLSFFIWLPPQAWPPLSPPDLFFSVLAHDFLCCLLPPLCPSLPPPCSPSGALFLHMHTHTHAFTQVPTMSGALCVLCAPGWASAFSQHTCQLPQALSPCGPLTVGLYAHGPAQSPGSQARLVPAVPQGQGRSWAGGCSLLYPLHGPDPRHVPSAPTEDASFQEPYQEGPCEHVAAQGLGSDMQGSNPSLTTCFGFLIWKMGLLKEPTTRVC